MTAGLNRSAATVVLFLALALRPSLAVDIEWGSTEPVGNPGTSNQLGLAADAQGNAYAAWFDTSTGDVLFAERPPGGPWNGPQLLHPGAFDALEVELTVDPAGAVHVVFAAWDWSDNKNKLLVTSLPAGGGVFGAPVPVSDDAGAPNPGMKFHPVIRADGAGGLHAVWRESRGGPPAVFYSTRPAGGAWSADVIVNDTTGAALWPDLAVSASGDALAVWADIRDGTATIYFDLKLAGGSFGADEKVSDAPPLRSTERPAIALSASGDVLVLWEDQRLGAGPEIRSSSRLGPNAWSPSVQVNTVPDPVIPRSAPAVAFDGGGRAYAAWSDRSGDLSFISAARLSGGVWGPETRASGPDVETAMTPRLAIDGSGLVHVIWTGNENGDNGVYHAVGSGPRFEFVRGDATSNEFVDISDVIFELSYLFLRGPAPRCLDAADGNDDGFVDVSDGIYVLVHLFLGGQPPPAPYPDPGVDPTPDEIECSDDCTPEDEVCDGVDNDCDGLIDEDFDFTSDPANCGNCGVTCAPAARASIACVGGQCAITSCDPLWFDVNGIYDDGCEIYAETGWEFASAAKDAGGSAADAAVILRDVYGLNARETVEVLHPIFIPDHITFATILRDTFGRNGAQATAILHELADISTYQAVAVLRDVFSFAPNGIATNLRTGFSQSVAEACALLREGGFSTREVANALALGYFLSNADLPAPLLDCGYTAPMTVDALLARDPSLTAGILMNYVTLAGYPAEEVAATLPLYFPNGNLVELAVLDVTFDPPDPVPGQFVTVNITCANSGWAEQTAHYGFTESHSSHGFEGDVTLASGETKVVSGTFEVPRDGITQRSVLATLYTDPPAAEPVIDNNALNATLTLGSGLILDFASPAITFDPEPDPPGVKETTNYGTTVGVEVRIINRSAAGPGDLTSQFLQIWARYEDRQVVVFHTDDADFPGGQVSVFRTDWVVSPVAENSIEVGATIVSDGQFHDVSRPYNLVRPDIALRNDEIGLYFDPPQPIADSLAWYHVKVYNARAVTQRIQFEAELDGVKLQQAPWERDIEPGAPHEISYSFTPPAGDHVFTARVIPVQGEINGANNVISRPLVFAPNLDGDAQEDAIDCDVDGDGLPERADTDGDGDCSEDVPLARAIDPAHRDRDADDDGLPDGWIDGWAYNGVEWGPFGDVNGLVDPWEGEDLDLDGVRDEGESHPITVDTDGDGFPDGVERTQGTAPDSRDTDGDGLTDWEERPKPDGTGTEPALADTDGDGADDYWEVRGWDVVTYDPESLTPGPTYHAKSNPFFADSDGDGLLDGEEFDLRTDPIDWDTDDDGLRDGEDRDAPLEKETESPYLVVRTDLKTNAGASAELTFTALATDNAGILQVEIDGEVYHQFGKRCVTQKHDKWVFPTTSYDIEVVVVDVNGYETSYTKHIPSAWEAVDAYLGISDGFGALISALAEFASFMGDQAQALIEAVVRPVLERAIGGVCSLQLVFDPAVFSAVLDDMPPLDLSSAASVEELRDQFLLFFSDALLFGLEDQVINSLPEGPRDAILGMRKALEAVEPVLNFVDKWVGGVQALLVSIFKDLLFQAASASGISALQTALEFAQDLPGLIADAADEAIPGILAAALNAMGVSENETDELEAAFEQVMPFVRVPSDDDGAGDGGGAGLNSLKCQVVSASLRDEFILPPMLVTGGLQCLDIGPDIREGLVVGIMLSFMTARERNIDNEFDGTTGDNARGFEVLISWDINCDDPGNISLVPNVDLYARTEFGFRQSSGPPWLGRIIRYPPFAELLNRMNEIPYCNPAPGFDRDFAKDYQRSMLEAMTPLPVTDAMVDAWTDAFQTSLEQRALRRKVGLGLYFGDRAAGPGFNLQVKMLELSIPDFFCADKWPLTADSFRHDWSVSLSLVDSGSGLSVSAPVYSSQW